jgi:hypothetical protein
MNHLLRHMWDRKHLIVRRGYRIKHNVFIGVAVFTGESVPPSGGRIDDVERRPATI